MMGSGNSTLVATYTWNGSNRLTQITDAGGSVTYTYNADGNLSSVIDPSGTTTMAYNSNDQRTGIAFPNGVTESMDYNRGGQLTKILAVNNGGVALDSYTYTYTNPATNTPTDMVYSVTNRAGDTTRYQYDALNRLGVALQTNGSGTPLAHYTYTYDPAGNMLSEDLNGTTTMMSDNAANELTQAGNTTYTHDANGNLTGTRAAWR